MGHIFEVLIEFFSGASKDKPNTMPEIEYKSEFTVRRPLKTMWARLAASFVIMTVFALLWIFIKDEVRALYAGFVGLGAVLALFTLESFAFKCKVDENRLSTTRCGIFKKSVDRKDVVCVKSIKIKNERAVFIAVYDRSGKCVIDLDTDMQNAWYVIKVAQHKDIEVAHAKGLTVKQMGRLF